MDILKEIDRIIDQGRYSKHSFVQRICSGACTRAQIKAWAIQKYYQTYEQNRVFSAIHSNARDKDIRQFMIEQLIEEEVGVKGKHDAHFNLMKRLALSMGASEQEISTTSIGKPVERFVNYLLMVCKREHPIYGMLAVYVNERQTPDAVMRLYHQFKKQFDMSDYELEWFLVHGQMDVDHSKRMRDLILKYAPQMDEFPSRSGAIVRRGIKEWLALHNFYYSLVI